MTTLFYISNIFLIIMELSWIIAPFEKTKMAKRFDELSKEFNGKEWDEYSDEYQSLLKKVLFNIPVLIWLFLGLFTSQWVAFLFIILFNILIISPISKLVKYSTSYTILHWINSLVGFLFAVFIIVNHYHLNIDLTMLLKQLF